MDVSSLYTNIPNDEGIESIQETLSTNGNPPATTDIMTSFLLLILTLNNFTFNGNHYLQVKGCAMGTKCAPSYANLFMGKFEKKYIYNRIKNKSKLYLRFIDDIFMIWTPSKEDLLNFIQEINQVHQSIKFIVEYSENLHQFSRHNGLYIQ